MNNLKNPPFIRPPAVFKHKDILKIFSLRKKMSFVNGLINLYGDFCRNRTVAACRHAQRSCAKRCYWPIKKLIFNLIYG